MPRHAPAAAIAAALSLLAAAAPAQPQELPDRIGAVLDAITDPEATAQEVGDAVSACVEPLGPKAPAHAPVIFDVAFDKDGTPGDAQLVIPTRETAGRIHMRQLIRAEAAIFACAPVEVGGNAVRDVTLRFIAEADRIDVWENQIPPQDTAAKPLSLSRADRRDVQIRLQLAGFDPGGTDGIFGPNTRSALRDWQQARGLAATGTLDRAQLDRLQAETQDAFAARQAEAARQRKARPKVYRAQDGCLRYVNGGGIVPGQSLVCDVRGLVSGGG